VGSDVVVVAVAVDFAVDGESVTIQYNKCSSA